MEEARIRLESGKNRSKGMNLEVWITHSAISDVGTGIVFRGREDKELGFLRLERNLHFKEATW